MQDIVSVVKQEKCILTNHTDFLQVFTISQRRTKCQTSYCGQVGNHARNNAALDRGLLFLGLRRANQ